MPLYVNDTEITDAEVHNEMQFHPAPSKGQAQELAAKALLIKELLRQQAIEEGYLETPANEDELETAIMQLVEQKVDTPEATEAVCRKYYDQNIKRFRVSKNTEIPKPFSVVKEQVRDYLHTRSIRQGVQSYILDLAKNAKIKGFDLAAML